MDKKTWNKSLILISLLILFNPSLLYAHLRVGERELDDESFTCVTTLHFF